MIGNEGRGGETNGAGSASQLRSLNNPQNDLVTIVTIVTIVRVLVTDTFSGYPGVCGWSTADISSSGEYRTGY